MIRRITVWLLIALLSVSVFTLGISAENVGTVQVESTTYNNYRSANTDTALGVDVITVGAEKAVLTGAKIGSDDEGAFVSLKTQGDKAAFGFELKNSGLYQFSVKYRPIAAQEKAIELDVLIDSAKPFEELGEIKLVRWWEDDGDKRIAQNGDEIAPHQKESFIVSEYALRDSVGLSNEPFAIALEAGSHSVEFELKSEAVMIYSITVAPATEPKTYKEIKIEWEKKGAQKAKGQPIIIQGEAADYKTLKSIVAKGDSANASLTPADASKNRLNYIGSNNWSNVGDAISWKINVTEAGLYTLGFHYRQNYVLDGLSYRRLEIDGEIPFKEASQLGFSYNTNWENTVFSDKNGEPYSIYLDEGEHTITLTVTMGPLAQLNEELERVVLKLGNIYRNITMVVGETADANRDYDLFGQIADLEENLTYCREKLDSIADEICVLSDIRSNSATVVLNNMANVIDRMLRNPYRATDYKSDYYNNYCSIGSILYEMRKTALDIDTITLSGEKTEGKKVSFGKQLMFSVQRFFSSFVDDYNISQESPENKKSISLWINWGRDQAQVLNSLIDETFTPEHGIGVNVKITNASLIQSMLSSSGTDVYLRMPRSQPVNMALRGALHDLSAFEDFDEVASRFMPTACVPYEFNGGCYALPDTQTFYMLFYRKDIFEEFGLELPRTWEEFLKVMTVLTRNNMQVGLPYVQFNGVTVADEGVGALNLYPSLVAQMGGKIYNKELTKTLFDTPVALEAFRLWTSFYTEYKMPVSYDFYNRFRSGEMPMAIQPYTQYTTLSVAALELSGLWGMAPIPGTVMEDGTVNNAVTGGGTGSVILANSKCKQEAWEFLKWWTSDTTQVQYIDEIETILGVAARQPTANVSALGQLSWKRDDCKVLMEQWEKVEEVPEAVGSYYTSRSLDQAFWSVYNDLTNPRDTLTEWGDIVNDEIARKRSEYNFD